MKAYIKNGRKTPAEKNLADALQKAIDRKIYENPDFAKDFKPARTIEQLKSLHKEHCVEDAQVIDVATDKNEEKSSISSGGEKKNTPEPDFDDNDSFIDPMNREEPIIRDYVLNDNFANSDKKSGIKQTVFNEPTSDFDSFYLPDEEEETGGKGDGNKQGLGNKQGGSNNGSGEKKQEKKAPLNPDFDDMSSGKKKRSTKKFATYIVEAGCMLIERGFIWYTTKDITEAKLAEYELNDEMDLDLFLSLDSGQQITVKQFFIMQGKTAQELAAFDPQEKKDLAESLAEVLMEKGFAPTPMQEFMLIFAQMVAKKGIVAITHNAETNAMLNQLRVMKQEGSAPQPQYQYQAPPKPIPAEPFPQPTAEPINNTANTDESEDDFAYYEKIMQDPPEELGGIVEKPLQTIE
jgi:hypothetical protein